MALEILGVNCSSFDDIVLENLEEEYVHVNWDNATPSSVAQHVEDWGMNPSTEDGGGRTIVLGQPTFLDNQKDTPVVVAKDCRKRRSRARKSKKEVENQRMTHIAVERNRRKQMNEYLSVLRGLMPLSYSQKGDQASIVGGAINYVKELEQQLNFLSGQNGIKGKHEQGSSSSSSQPFEEFFIFPQYSNPISTTRENLTATTSPATGSIEASEADIEVTMVDNHANLKVRSKKRFKKLAKLVRGLESLELSVLHLNIVTVDLVVLYSLSLKVEDDCMLRSSEDIAAAVNCLLLKIDGGNNYQEGGKDFQVL